MPKSTEEYYNALKAFKENGLGGPETIPETKNLVMRFIQTMNSEISLWMKRKRLCIQIYQFVL